MWMNKDLLQQHKQYLKKFNTVYKRAKFQKFVNHSSDGELCVLLKIIQCVVSGQIPLQKTRFISCIVKS